MAVAATGFFDGVHLGHRKIIETLVETARRRGEESLIVTFWPHPRIALGKDASSLKLLLPLEEKIRMIRELGVDRVEVLEFTPQFASMTAAGYLQMLARDFSVTAVVLGYDTRMGSDQLGPDEIARAAGGLDIFRCGPVGTVSSTKIRNLVSAGRLDEASSLLGYDYSEKLLSLQNNEGSANQAELLFNRTISWQKYIT